ncbi:carbohydrate-binding family 9-like protein [Plebeiibacterium marinum]|uniref:Carbohydrate-binding family 9-like protein n=1 Tax=Plebeiibacterium marinum TaxID=2992111 RepID=A0AAE3MEM0_9BACT|nr:carbohydrate-binding family 9-like protein [Plebeiobacterium marinum]MCW3806389.1 carbohydrate-binding family 9-like protein [Plebeiobacterium marinum]
MEKIIVDRIENVKGWFAAKELERNSISCNNWDYQSDVNADFVIGYDCDNLYLKFFVQESNTKAVNTKYNEPVYEDSCVEFFVSFDGEKYYNLEFNCIGNVLGGYGANRNNRERLATELLTKISTKPSLGKNRINIIDRKTEWSLEVVIPKAVFKNEEIKTFEGLKTTCNFYKCGDKQAFPHYLSWSPISVENPDFHLPEFFGEVVFGN